MTRRITLPIGSKSLRVSKTRLQSIRMTLFAEVDAVDCFSEPFVANVAVALMSSSGMPEDGHPKLLIKAQSVSFPRVAEIMEPQRWKSCRCTRMFPRSFQFKSLHKMSIPEEYALSRSLRITILQYLFQDRHHLFSQRDSFEATLLRVRVRQPNDPGR